MTARIRRSPESPRTKSSVFTIPAWAHPAQTTSPSSVRIQEGEIVLDGVRDLPFRVEEERAAGVPEIRRAGDGAGQADPFREHHVAVDGVKTLRREFFEGRPRFPRHPDRFRLPLAYRVTIKRDTPG